MHGMQFSWFFSNSFCEYDILVLQLPLSFNMYSFNIYDIIIFMQFTFLEIKVNQKRQIFGEFIIH